MAVYHNGLRVPDFFVVGHAKCGTTAIYEMLRAHPQIFMPDLKEPEFMASDMRRQFRPAMAGPLPETMDDYLALFADAQREQLAGEATVQYLTSATAASTIAQLNPAARIIAVFREPAAFIRSVHLQNIRDHNERERNLRRAMALERARRDGKNIPKTCYRPQALNYSKHVRYAEQLGRYLANFPRSQILVLIYEEFRADNVRALNTISQFLSVDNAFSITSVKVNPTLRLRSHILDDAVHRVSVGRGPYSRALKAGIKRVLPRRARRRMLRAVRDHIVYAAPPPVDEKFMSELRVPLKREVERFGERLERDLVSFWGYHDV